MTLRCFGSLRIYKLNSILISLSWRTLKLQEFLLSERKIWNLFPNIFNFLAYLENWIANILNQIQTYILYCFLIVFELQNSLCYALLRIPHISMDVVSNNKDQSLNLKIMLITMLFRHKHKITCINLDMLRLQCITCPWYFQKDTNKIWMVAVKPLQLYDSLGKSGYANACTKVLHFRINWNKVICNPPHYLCKMGKDHVYTHMYLLLSPSRVMWNKKNLMRINILHEQIDAHEQCGCSFSGLLREQVFR